MSDGHVQSQQYRAITVDNGGSNGESRTSCARIVTNILLLAVLVVAVISLVYVIRNNNSNQSSGSSIINLGNQKSVVKAYYDGGQYSRDLDDVTGVWTDYFNSKLPVGADPKKHTVVFDLDETVLWNMQVIFDNDFGFIAKEWDPWVQSANATCIAQTCAFYHFLVKNNFNIVFITGRHEYQRTATALNLERIGLTTYDRLILRQTYEDKMSATVYKSGHRRNLTESGYEVVGCAGDQLSDCQGGFAGYIMKVPNYAYFIA